MRGTIELGLGVYVRATDTVMAGDVVDGVGACGANGVTGVRIEPDVMRSRRMGSGVGHDNCGVGLAVQRTVCKFQVLITRQKVAFPGVHIDISDSVVGQHGTGLFKCHEVL